LKIDAVNQIGNSDKFQLDDTCLGIALGYSNPISNRLKFYYHGGIDLNNDTSFGIAIADSSNGNLSLTKGGSGNLALSISNGLLNLLNSGSGAGCQINLTVNDVVNGTINLTGGTINLNADVKTLTDKDIEISDTSMGLVMSARGGTKKFRVYISDDLGTITAEEI
jgi:hypothetical protein